MNSPDHSNRLLGLHNQRPQHSSFFPVSGGSTISPPQSQAQTQMVGRSSTITTTSSSSAPASETACCRRQQQPQLSSGVDICVEHHRAPDSDDLNGLSKLLDMYDHDFDRVQRHLEGALRHTQGQLQLSKAEKQARKRHQQLLLPEQKTTGAMGDMITEGANGVSLMNSLEPFVAAPAATKDNNSSSSSSSPQAMMQLPSQASQQQQDMLDQLLTTAHQRTSTGAQGDGRGSSSSPGILSYTGTIKTALGPSPAQAPASSSSPSAAAPPSNLLGMAVASANRRSSFTGSTGVDPPSSLATALGNQAQAQASYGVDAAFSAGAISSGGDTHANTSVVMQQANNVNGTIMKGPLEPSSLSIMSANDSGMFGISSNNNNNNNSNNSNNNAIMMNNGNMMAGGGDGGLDLGCLTPPTHPSAHGQDNNLLPPNNVVHQNNFQQQQQQQQQQSNFSIAPSALMSESLTAPPPFDMSNIASIPIPQTVLRSQSVGSVQSTMSFASAGSASSDLGVNNRSAGRVVGGGFLGPGRALGPGGIGIKRANRSRGRSDGSNSSSIDTTNNLATKSNIQALLRQHASIGGKHPNAEGMCPIHIACREYATNARLIGTMLCTSPGVGRLVVGRGSSVGTQVINRRASLSSMHSGESSSSNTVVMEGSYPIHIALANSPSVEVVTLLVRQNPELLIKGDGTNRVPLSIAFSEGASLEVLDLLLGMNPNAAAIPDLRNNYPLHLACARRIGGGWGRINLNLLRRLVEAYPAAVHKRNFNGKTPLELAQDGGLTDDDAISYLHEMAYMERDDDVIEAPDA